MRGCAHAADVDDLDERAGGGEGLAQDGEIAPEETPDDGDGAAPTGGWSRQARR